MKVLVDENIPLRTGVLVVRLRQPNRERIHARVLTAMAQFPPHGWAGLVVVMRAAVRSVRRSRPKPAAAPTAD